MASGFPREPSQSSPEARHVNLYRAQGVAALVDPLAPAELGNAVSAAQPGEHDPALPLAEAASALLSVSRSPRRRG
jgi:hypothetical protein